MKLDANDAIPFRPEGFKFAGFSGPHPSLVVDCSTCGSPVGHYCNDDQGRPVDRPHDARRARALDEEHPKP